LEEEIILFFVGPERGVPEKILHVPEEMVLEDSKGRQGRSY
jgi:hypothetical protein